jgi:uncharacterized small protein (DUF1192 family)
MARSMFIVCGNRTMVEMVRLLPATEEELLELHGMGELKVQRYGEILLGALRPHIERLKAEHAAAAAARAAAATRTESHPPPTATAPRPDDAAPTRQREAEHAQELLESAPVTIQFHAGGSGSRRSPRRSPK